MRKAFDIKAAQAGAKVVTRDGRPVEIFKYDFKDNGKLRIAYCCTDEYGDNHAYLVNHDGVWTEAKESDHDLFLEVEPKYRPYANAEEMDAAIKKHGLLVKHRNGMRKVIRGYDDEEVAAGGGYSYWELLEYFKWLDGMPCGILEGGKDE